MDSNYALRVAPTLLRFYESMSTDPRRKVFKMDRYGKVFLKTTVIYYDADKDIQEEVTYRSPHN